MKLQYSAGDTFGAISDNDVNGSDSDTIVDISNNIKTILSIMMRSELGKSDGNRHMNRVQLVQELNFEQRVRAEFVDSDVLSESAWSMMLDLYEAAETGRDVSVSSLALACSIPVTTGLRYIKLLVDYGYMERKQDTLDQRRTHMRLTSKGKNAVTKYLERIAERRLIRLTENTLG